MALIPWRVKKTLQASRDFLLGRSIGAVNASYDQETVDVMRRVLRADSHAIDVGAHTGDILRHICAIAPTGQHHAFEALPHLIPGLRQEFPIGVTIHQYAVSDRPGAATFQWVENDPAYSGLRARIYDRPDPQVQTINVEMTTLDEAVPRDEPIAFIKLDIEGGEYHALKGGARLIQRWHPLIVFEAGAKSTGQYGVTPEQLFDVFDKDFGYDLTTMRRWLTAVGQPYTKEMFAHNWRHGPDFYFLGQWRQRVSP